MLLGPAGTTLLFVSRSAASSARRHAPLSVAMPPWVERALALGAMESPIR